MEVRTRDSKQGPFTIVIKLGTSSIVHETTHQPLLSLLSSIVETVIKLKEHGHRVVLVSSGAIGVGLKRMDLPSRPKTLSGKQALAAIGQGRLIALWDNLFGQLGTPIAQILLTRGDLSDRSRYLNAVNTLSELIAMGVVPIINENDTVSVSEIKFGDNDTLSAITAAMLRADYLFLMTDVDGLYTSNPRKDPKAKRIDVVDSISAIRLQVSTQTLGSNLGTGGMETKLIAADIATGAGVTTVVASSKDPSIIFDIIQWNIHSARLSMSQTSPPHSPSPSPPIPQERPPHTSFTPSTTPMSDLKSWTFYTLTPAGTVIVDQGAYRVLSKRESGGRLLPAGVLGVRGNFASGQAVRIAVRVQQSDEERSRSRPRSPIDSPLTQPTTPTLLASMLKSTTSADGGLGLSRSSSDVIPSTSSTASLPVSGSMTPASDDEHHNTDDRGDEDTWQLLEVGRGLANYNSAAIRQVKGLKSAMIAQTLGYADSEYVAENITIRVPA
ncbi:glutamate 5-kinase [Sistotremastrum suecicum HHB10207 ss-3]|uniref:Glutamate 5-kinase n=1 Tax=Sistotremastrum suecicum HHB10207 ss-3 TaxID=1314776 RepID=A0A165YX92_9AGAM|nr:glutamate 5-kinase [Sistotremastrum suecicum HHB10207 ss-3]